jgi:hypothetical protein
MVVLDARKNAIIGIYQNNNVKAERGEQNSRNKLILMSLISKKNIII